MCLPVYRNEFVELGTTVTLKCSNTKIAWNDMIFVIWKIPMRDTYCIIAVAKNDSDHDTCHDGKKQNHTADGTYHLIIPKFSVQDEGNYTCDTLYQEGGSVEIIRVSAWARPHLTGWLENEGGHTVAVCEATGKPAASIYWETPWNSSSITQTSKNTGQLSTVISRLYLPQNTSYRNLICVATANDAMHTVTRFSNFTFTFIDNVKRPIIVYFVLGSIIASLTGLYIMRKKLTIIRKLCCKPNNQLPNNPDEVQIYTDLQSGPSIYNTLFPTVQETQAQTEIYVNTERHH
ncbi:hypothetical protein KOW79_004835 [Hemibagrus wyckioides]|uniref:Ig-like domain-containing protein n=1 Tax=Hemibagrus wyckioides TaxID=337641 RepID=A0A9D3NX42_9TELE|nr:hypothetical protein KOW79_004835 [Hemibagrus wyckioides]